MLDKTSLKILREALEKLDAGFAALPQFDARVPGAERVADILAATAERLHDNFPYFHPLYAGQMLKPPHPVARLAYALAQWINPNNHALDGGRATSTMEKDAVSGIAAMFGWRRHLGHLCGGGTMANLEALWVAGQLVPGKKILASEQAHYTHARISSVLQLPFASVPCDARGRMDLTKLGEMASRGDVGTLVATMGTTATGSVDPLAGILELRQKHGFRIHADAAYGGYFGLAGNLGEEARREFDLLPHADSIVIDPHKHGLQPYGCGCVLFRDSAVGKLYKHDSPYTYFSSTELHLGEISLECSRPGAAAAALWATQNLLPLVKGGEFAHGLEDCREAALDFHRRLEKDARFVTAFPPEMDIVVFAPRAESVSESSERSRKIFDAAARKNLHLAVAELPVQFFEANLGAMNRDRKTLTCLRSVLMKPEHKDWLGRIWDILGEATEEVAEKR
ncbi:MAG TPA: aminotransferase class I/II-fold pyridoxal phosphate-dependent enzyme [Candidatus Sulfotelmatobacter sp.]|jgi:tyrosine decarboxylase/aspartate 1-decarboxylase|nr:aminotransferase class I/II-fold pyridoxal phosphate-dependent enzyme [Candidatus Sulfotelmatobacter sp.]